MSISQMKHALITASPYQSTSWKRKVSKFSDAQVIAVYYNFLERGILLNKKKINPKGVKG